MLDPADSDTVRQALVSRDALLGQHDRILADVRGSLRSLSFCITSLRGPDNPASPVQPPPLQSQCPPESPFLSPSLSIPECYSGEAGRCGSFLLQCSYKRVRPPTLNLSHQQGENHVDCSFIVWGAAPWVTAVIDNQTCYGTFKPEFSRVFEYPVREQRQRLGCFPYNMWRRLWQITSSCSAF